MELSENEAYVKMPAADVRLQCTSILLQVAREHKVPASYIVAHVRNPAADSARKRVQREMLGIGLTRGQVAMAFGRDLRRVRRNLVGSKPGERWVNVIDYRKYDLFGMPIEKPAPRKKHPSLALRLRKVIDALRIVSMELGMSLVPVVDTTRRDLFGEVIDGTVRTDQAELLKEGLGVLKRAAQRSEMAGRLWRCVRG